MTGQRGQAAVEVLGGLPLLLGIAVAVSQLLAVGYAALLAGNAAEAGALAVAGGANGADSAKASLPGWSRARAAVAVSEGRVTVHLRPPTLFPGAGRALEVTSIARVVR